MALSPDARLGPYEVLSALGAGGMGEVYKARDTRLDRIVAIKILSPSLAADPQFRERFEREARMISQLTHPNICTVFDIAEAPDPAPETDAPIPAPIRFLVMEYLEGETLATRLERGALALDDVLKIGGEISSALDAAHRVGIVHRDLKPGNVMLTRSGAKLLDFGLAKRAAPFMDADGSVVQLAASGAVTTQGVIVGTFQYMAPEQLEGAEADARADVFAFGAILYEMVTGRKAFEGKTAVSLIGAILRDQPPRVATLTPGAPKALDQIIRACLAKDPDARLRSTHDLFLQLQWMADGDEPPAPREISAPHRHRRDGRTWAVAAAIGIVLLGAGVLLLRGRGDVPAATDAIEFTIPAPENSAFSGGGGSSMFAASPDGRHIVFVATTPGGGSKLFLRSMGALAVTPLPGTDQPAYPFWSPDSRSVAFFAAGKLKKIQIAGGSSPIVVGDAASGRGGTWNRDDLIVFAPTVNGALQRVSAAGGATAPATTIDSAHGETAHRWPYFLPDGRHFLYLAASSEQQPSEVMVGALDSKEATKVVAAESMATYASGHLFFWRDGGVLAQPFDAEARQAKGDPFKVAEPVGQGGGYASFSVSQTGVMVYARAGARPTSQLTWMDRAGKLLKTVGEPGDYYNISLAPDERRVAVSLQAGAPENRDIWVLDLARSVSSRVTFDPASEFLPAWSPDGARIAFGSSRAASGLYVKNASGSGQEELLMKYDVTDYPTDWSSDGRFILYSTQSPKTGFDLWLLPLTGDRKALPFLESPFNEDHGAFAPDVHWVAYSSNESGHEEVYVQHFPATGDKYRISTNGGTQPTWRGDGRELFFLAPDGALMATSIGTGNAFTAGIPQPLFATGVAAFTNNRRQYSVTRDGQRFLINAQQQGSSPTPLTVVVNWQAAGKH